MRKKLKDEPSSDEHMGDQNTPHLSGSLEILDIRLNPNIAIPQTRAAARARRTQAPVTSPSQCEERGSDKSGIVWHK